jgi:hypothetical protein
LWNTRLFGGVWGRSLSGKRLQIADEFVDCIIRIFFAGFLPSKGLYILSERPEHYARSCI